MTSGESTYHPTLVFVKLKCGWEKKTYEDRS